MWKKGELELDKLIKTLIVIIVIAVVAGGIFLFFPKVTNVFDFIRKFMRFGA